MQRRAADFQPPCAVCGICLDVEGEPSSSGVAAEADAARDHDAQRRIGHGGTLGLDRHDRSRCRPVPVEHVAVIETVENRDRGPELFGGDDLDVVRRRDVHAVIKALLVAEVREGVIHQQEGAMRRRVALHGGLRE